MMMIKTIIIIIRTLITELIKICDLEALWMNDIRKAQNEYRKQSGHILNKYDQNCWKEDYLW